MDLFSTEFQQEHFENHSRENGFTHWMARDLMEFLGYESWQSFQKSINKAMTTCTTLNIPIIENFVNFMEDRGGKSEQNFKLSRFACYLVAMASDTKKPAVAKAQAYFASLAGAVDNYLAESENVERLVMRDEIYEREKSLTGVAHGAGVIQYAFFQNAGYRGMYNMHLNRLREKRGIPSTKSPLDFMGKEELAANLFRITQTELKIKNDGIYGQAALESTAENVGRQVRKTMIEISGVAPEALPQAQEIKEVKKGLKTKNKEIKKLDSKKTPKK